MNVNVNLNMNRLLFCKPFVGPLLKSTQDKMERQQECQNTVDFFENQISMLKNMNSDSLEDIKKKLEMFHNYKDSIDAAKQKYNNEQMFHTLDEAKEKGEKMAEAAEDMKPKTAEERREDQAEEVRDDMKQDTDDNELTESMEEITDDAEEILEEMTEKITEEMAEKVEEQKIEQQVEQQIEQQIEEQSQDMVSKKSQVLASNVSDLSEGLTPQEKNLALLEYYKKQGYSPVNYYV